MKTNIYTFNQTWVLSGKLGRFHLWIGVGHCQMMKDQSDSVIHRKMEREIEKEGGLDGYMSEREDARREWSEMWCPRRRRIRFLREKLKALPFGFVFFDRMRHSSSGLIQIQFVDTDWWCWCEEAENPQLTDATSAPCQHFSSFYFLFVYTFVTSNIICTLVSFHYMVGTSINLQAYIVTISTISQV